MGQLHEDLEQLYRTTVEEFDKRHGNLSLVHIRIQQKIEQISRLRDGVYLPTSTKVAKLSTYALIDLIRHQCRRQSRGNQTK
jgi:hypothetical protein